MSMHMPEWAYEVYGAAIEWREARSAMVTLPMNDPGARKALNRLSEAEDALSKAVKRAQGERNDT